jgi:hypothetical protein|tara:strand:- start:37 stop:363 length:327 start_codon:yes stop_codon:yes gene_type:complete
MSIVYIVQEPANRNFTPAKKYGKLKSLVPDRVQVQISAAPVIRRLRGELKDFSNNDYLLLSGDPIIIGLAIVVAGENNMGRINVLKWDKQEKTYNPIEIDLYPKEGDK